MQRFLLAFGLSLLALTGHAGTAEPVSADPALEERVMDLSHKLRCLVCQNQSIAESDADLAVDLRTQVREQLSAGKTEDEIADYMVARYGDFVLYEPPMRAGTLLLWFGPIVLAVVGLLALALRLKRRNSTAAPALDAAQRARARALLEKGDDSGASA